MRFVQIHLILDKDNNGIPFSLVHTRLSFGMFQTRWQLTACASLDGKPGLNHNQSRQRLNVYSSMSLVVTERGSRSARAPARRQSVAEIPKSHERDVWGN
jgi:hypothetical protein